MRGWMDDAPSYMPPIPLGTPVRASITGLLVADYVPRFGEGIAAMAGWMSTGKLVFDEHVDEGIDQALPAFMRLFSGSNDGKMILKLS